jgi:hypothetical protein
VAVHTILPPALTDAVDEVLRAAGERHVAHSDGDPVGAAVAAASAHEAKAVIGPFRSRAVAEAVEATAPAGFPLLAPVATWVGVTRDDEPGCDDAAQHEGTVLRMVARDMVVAQRIAERLRGQRALVIVLAGLVGEPEADAARVLAPLPIVAFDGIQGEAFQDQEVTLALVYAPGPVGVAEARRAAEIVVQGDPVDPLVRFERYDA